MPRKQKRRQNQAAAAAAAAEEDRILDAAIAEVAAKVGTREHNEALSATLTAEAAAHGLAPHTAYGAAPTFPSKPECDACGGSGATHKCSRCLSAHYCSPACQAADWKPSGGNHKAACATMRAEIAALGTRVVAQLRAVGELDVVQRLYPVHGDHLLDGAGAYEAAVGAGLHAAIAECCAEDEAEVRGRFAGRDRMMQECMMRHLSCTLFRGQRRSRGVGGGTGKADGVRAAAYIQSAPGAWLAWLRAAAALAAVATDGALQRADASAHAHAHRSNRDCLSFMTLALARPEVGAAVLFGGGEGGGGSGEGGGGSGGEAEGGGGGGGGGEGGGGGGEGGGGGGAELRERAVRRARESAAVLAAAMERADGVGEARDPRENCAQNLACIGAMLASWCRRLGVAADVQAVYRMSGRRLMCYERVARPIAEAFIDKGRNLSPEESRAAMTAAR